MKYQLAGEDENTFHVQHPNGEVFQIAKSAIGPEVHSRIKKLEPIKMSDGGIAEKSDDTTLKNSDQTVTEDTSEGGQALRRFFGMPTSTDALTTPPAGTSFDEYNTQSTMPLSAPIPTEAPIVGPSPASVAGTQQPVASIPQQPVAQTPNPLDPNAGMALQNKALDQQKAAVQSNVDVQKKEFQNQANREVEFAKKAAQIDADVKNTTAPWIAENDMLHKAILDQKIDPSKLWQSSSTGNKVGAALSIILSGIGAGMQGPGARNMALDVINKSIDRDIEAQKLELGKKQTLFSENLRRVGDANAAAALTKSQLLTSVQAMNNAGVSRMNSSQAAMQGQITNNEIDLKKAGLMNQAAILQMAKQGGGSDPSMFVSHLVPKEHQKAVFDEIQRAQDTKHMGKSILEAFDTAATENTIARTGAGLLRTPGSVYALHQAMQPTFKDLEGTVRQAAMDNTFKNITPMPGDTQHKIDQKREALEQYLQSKAAAPTAKGFGIDLDRFGTTTTAQQGKEVERMDPASGKIVIYDSKTKQPLRYK